MRNHSETIKRPHHRNVGNDVSVGKAERKARIERNDNEKGEERGKKKRGNEKRPSVSMRRDAWFRARKFIPRLLIRRTSRVDRSLEGKKKTGAEIEENCDFKRSGASPSDQRSS